MWIREQYPPAVVANPLDPTGEVAFAVAAILIGLGFIPQNQRAEEHLAQLVRRIDKPDLALRSGQLGETLRRALLDAAAKCRIGNIFRHSLALRADLDHPALI